MTGDPNPSGSMPADRSSTAGAPTRRSAESLPFPGARGVRACRGRSFRWSLRSNPYGGDFLPALGEAPWAVPAVVGDGGSGGNQSRRYGRRRREMALGDRNSARDLRHGGLRSVCGLRDRNVVFKHGFDEKGLGLAQFSNRLVVAPTLGYATRQFQNPGHVRRSLTGFGVHDVDSCKVMSCNNLVSSTLFLLALQRIQQIQQEVAEARGAAPAGS